jgi:hypothetical protein
MLDGSECFEFMLDRRTSWRNDDLGNARRTRMVQAVAQGLGVTPPARVQESGASGIDRRGVPLGNGH